MTNAMLGLKSHTDSAWTKVALSDEIALLRDHAHLERKAAGHMITLMGQVEGASIDDLEAAVAWLTNHGVRFAPGGIRKGASGFDICFIHPKADDEFPIAGEGVLIELVQAPREVRDALE